MKLGIIGLPLAGKTTVFEILTRQTESTIPKTEYRIGTVTVPNAQIDTLSQIYNPKKTTYAQVEYLLPGMNISQDAQIKEQHVWTHIRTCDSLIHVVCNFQAQDPDASDPVDHIRQLDHEMIFADLIIVEKRLERMTEDKKRNKPVDEEEQAMLLQCQTLLEEDTPIRKDPELSSAPKLRGYTLLSAKPMLILFNNKDGNDALPPLPDTLHADTMVVQGKLEHEIAQMDNTDAQSFMTEFGIIETARNRVIRKSYDLLGLMSFFTVGEDEVRAWTIRKYTPAVDAAEVIHSDIKKGFIRAEVVAYDHLIDAGNYAEARKKGRTRLEGKTYIVQNSDIIDFRFNV